MKGIDLRYLELINVTYILGQRKRIGLYGNIFEADIYIDDVPYAARICRYWLGGGKLISVASDEIDMMCLIQSKIEDYYTSLTGGGPGAEYTLREIAKFLLILAMEYMLIRIVGCGYKLIRLRGSTSDKDLYIQAVRNMIINGFGFIVFYIIRLKVYSLWMKEGCRHEEN